MQDLDNNEKIRRIRENSSLTSRQAAQAIVQAREETFFGEGESIWALYIAKGLEGAFKGLLLGLPLSGLFIIAFGVVTSFSIPAAPLILLITTIVVAAITAIVVGALYCHTITHEINNQTLIEDSYRKKASTAIDQKQEKPTTTSPQIISSTERQWFGATDPQYPWKRRHQIQTTPGAAKTQSKTQ